MKYDLPLSKKFHDYGIFNEYLYKYFFKKPKLRIETKLTDKKKKDHSWRNVIGLAVLFSGAVSINHEISLAKEVKS